MILPSAARTPKVLLKPSRTNTTSSSRVLDPQVLYASSSQSGSLRT